MGVKNSNSLMSLSPSSLCLSRCLVVIVMLHSSPWAPPACTVASTVGALTKVMVSKGVADSHDRCVYLALRVLHSREQMLLRVGI